MYWNAHLCFELGTTHLQIVGVLTKSAEGVPNLVSPGARKKGPLACRTAPLASRRVAVDVLVVVVPPFETAQRAIPEATSPLGNGDVVTGPASTGLVTESTRTTTSAIVDSVMMKPPQSRQGTARRRRPPVRGAHEAPEQRGSAESSRSLAIVSRAPTSLPLLAALRRTLRWGFPQADAEWRVRRRGMGRAWKARRSGPTATGPAPFARRA